MLAAWIRMKYPSTIWGALAASAPVRWFKGTIDPGAYMNWSEHVIRNLNNGNECADIMSPGFRDLVNLKEDPAFYTQIGTLFNVCAANPEATPPIPAFDTPEMFQALIDEVVDTIAGSAQTNYPDGSIPNQVQVMCDAAIAGHNSAKS